MIAELIQNPSQRITWWDYGGGEPELTPMQGSLLPCGCHIRVPDYEPVLCEHHLAELNGAAADLPVPEETQK